MKKHLEGRVSDWMVKPVRTLQEETLLSEAARQFELLGVSALPVLDLSARLTGVFSRTDLVRAGRFVSQSSDRARHLYLPQAPVGDFMKTSVPVIRPYFSLGVCARRMFKRGLHRLYVAEDGPLEGVLSTREMLSAVISAGIETRLSQFAQRAIATMSVRDPLASAMARLRANGALTLVVTDDAVPVGVFSRADAVASREADPTEAMSLWMDANVVSVPADSPAHRAAQQLHAAKGRYVAVCEGRTILGIISGLGFTELLATQAGL
ncbi:MAG TPA: CBS domain-containing protein [Polyangiaceae bacterium]|nr:CBS domain-containing protein [Polyangiaceae bacterium]